MIRDQTSDRNTITIESFARRIASAVSRFLSVSPLHLGISAVIGRDFNGLHLYWLQEAESLEGQDPNRRVGVGGIIKDQVILVGVVHVSRRSWQPILQLTRYVVPRRQHIPGLLWCCAGHLLHPSRWLGSVPDNV